MQENDQRRFAIAHWLLIALFVLLMGGLNLPQPFMGDQAFNTTMARVISGGGIMYQDLWDLKQPGIFLFLCVGGQLFGFTEIGIHLFELAYMLAFAFVLLATLRTWFANPKSAGLAVVFTVGFYYASTGMWHQTQTEPLVGFPIFLSLWFAHRGLRSSTSLGSFISFLASGISGGVAVVFKIPLLLLVGTFWVAALVDQWLVKKRHRLLTCLVRLGIPLATGLLIPLAVVASYFFKHRILDLVLWTYFKYPFEALQYVSFRVHALVNGFAWFVGTMGILFPLAAVGGYVKLRRRWDYLTAGLVLWLFVGFGLLMMQRLSWWQYHYYLLLVPLGILAALGVEALLPRVPILFPTLGPRENRRLASACLVLLLSPLLVGTVVKAGLLATHRFAMSEADLLEYQVTLNPGYRTIRDDVKYLDDIDYQGPIYVFGDPLYYHISRRLPAISWSVPWSSPTPEFLNRLAADLESKPPRYVFLHKQTFDRMRDYVPTLGPNIDDLESLVEWEFTPVCQTPSGTWYAHVESTEAETHRD